MVPYFPSLASSTCCSGFRAVAFADDRMKAVDLQKSGEQRMGHIEFLGKSRKFGNNQKCQVFSRQFWGIGALQAGFGDSAQ